MRKILRRALTGYMSRHARHALSELRSAQKLDPAKHEESRRRRVGSLLTRAAQQVPYYRRTLDLKSLVDDRGRVVWEAFHQLPVMDKDTIRAHWQDLQAEGSPGGVRFQNYSGGSSGEPLRLVQDQTYRAFNSAVKTLMDEWGGIRPGDRVFKIWGSMRDHETVSSGWRDRLIRWASNTEYVNPFNFYRQEEMEDLVRHYNRVRCDQLMGYTEFMLDVAKVARRAGIPVHRPRSIMTTATTLTDEVRGMLGEVFGAPVFNRYGSREVGDMACDCERHEGLHVCAHTHEVEILDERGRAVAPGVQGDIVVTCLTNLSMPFVRYRIGDLASWTGRPCSCGRPWPLLANVDGRTADFFFARDGRKFFPGILHSAFYYRDWVKRFQAVQETLDLVVVKVLPRPGLAMTDQEVAQELAEIRARLLEMWGETSELRLEIVDDIPPSPSGKFAHLVSKVKPADVPSTSSDRGA